MMKLCTESLMRSVVNNKRLVGLMKIFCHFTSALCVIGFGYLCFSFYTISLFSLIGLLVTLGAPFALVSLMRRFINAKRPYEIYDFFVDPPKAKKGHSFPSRHAFSAFAIGTVALFVSLPIGILILFLGCSMCICRVALGIHFVRDVVGGAIIGVVTSLIGAIILL